jgi:2'-hydroxyisoflavone reductase
MRLMPDRSIIVRPTSIVGDRDDEMTMVWWLWRMRHGGRILVPGDGSDAVQWIDVKDAGRFIVALIERGVAGSFNAVGPSADQETFGEMIRTMFKGYGKVADLVWVPKDFLYGLGLKSATDLPLWRPSSEWGSFYKLSAMKSVHSGLRHRSEQRTFADVLGGYDAAHKGSPHPYLVKTNRGISAERESMVLTAWAQARCVSGNKCRWPLPRGEAPMTEKPLLRSAKQAKRHFAPREVLAAHQPFESEQNLIANAYLRPP